MMPKSAGRRANESAGPIVFAGSGSTELGARSRESTPCLHVPRSRLPVSLSHPEAPSLDRPPMPVSTTAVKKRKTSPAVQSPLETYLREINQTALLNAAEERELATEIGNGDTAARDRMVRANLRLGANIAPGHPGTG